MLKFTQVIYFLQNASRWKNEAGVYTNHLRERTQPSFVQKYCRTSNRSLSIKLTARCEQRRLILYFDLVWWRVLRPEWSYTAGLLSLLGEPPNAADHGATVCLGIALPKP